MSNSYELQRAEALSRAETAFDEFDLDGDGKIAGAAEMI